MSRGITARLAAASVVPLLLCATAEFAHAQSLRGSLASVRRSHAYARTNGLHFHRTGASVRASVSAGRLVALRPSADLRLAGVAHPYVRPTTALFVRRLAAQHRARCGEPLVLTGATRPLSVRLPNGSARSVHPAGIAVDLRRPTGACLAWLRRTLLTLEESGLIDGTEERHPPHFHVVVFEVPYRQYLVQRGVLSAPRRASAEGR
ncbi:MAG TPA: DUF5715 family protein [Gemmatimonadaceae bacterium]|nr:DUF5715 family protein [Gemmatimonadaceae bacterium]